MICSVEDIGGGGKNHTTGTCQPKQAPAVSPTDGRQ